MPLDPPTMKTWRFFIIIKRRKREKIRCNGHRKGLRNDHELVQSIAQHVHEELIRKLPSSMKNLIGIDSRYNKVIELIGKEKDDVRFIGICGMGGIGKTTVASRVWEGIQGEFEASGFFADVKEIFEKEGIVAAQKRLLNCMRIEAIGFSNENDGRRIIHDSLCNKKVLLVLDNVDTKVQLQNLAGEKGWFGSGSRIIFTSRDKNLLHEWCGENEIYMLKGLEQIEALQLFSLNAFGCLNPEEENVNMSKEVVGYCDGLPLALKVLGCHFRGRPIDIWRDDILKLKRGLKKDIFCKLKISYDGLDRMDKDIFLDIACFFRGEHVDVVQNILQHCDYNAKSGIATLIDRSLVTLNENGRLEMHDLLEEMGKQIEIEKSPYDPDKRDRLWSAKDADDVLTQEQETETTRSIVLKLNSQYNILDKHFERRWRDLAFSNIRRLKLLILNGVKVPIVTKIPISLKVLHWMFFPMKNLPLEDKRYYKLVQIRLSLGDDLKHVWQGNKRLENLKSLHLSWCRNLEATPDFSGAPNLEILEIRNCYNLDKIDPSLVCHKKLVALTISRCARLETIPSKLEMSSLQELKLEECDKLEILPEFGECMRHLSSLTLCVLPIKELPSSLGCLVGLSELKISRCHELTCLPDSIHGLKSLTLLDVFSCPSLLAYLHLFSSLTSLTSLTIRNCYLMGPFPDNVGHFQWLIDLDLSDNNFVSVPIRIHELPRLTSLKLYGCRYLNLLPELPSSLRELHVPDCKSLQDASNVNNVVSKLCYAFADSSMHDGDVFQMYMAGETIPSWFNLQEQGDGVSVPFLDNCASETKVLALCFQIYGYWNGPFKLQPSLIFNGKSINKTSIQIRASGGNSHHFILFLTNDYSHELLPRNCFELLIPGHNLMKVKSSGARWVSKGEIEEFMKSEPEK
ncbi:hypothetical protein PIB30_033300 [Stylosanthes scabra]|uniref:NB-ARC domain-containing protein n=1 Tax=Stylosanthes scabra TaxID=79078 RepID=A0ABU6TD64_9FABA|nr:hypothetical protein [Stylosanthes scabra]